jgi:hypothetical protein
MTPCKTFVTLAILLAPAAAGADVRDEMIHYGTNVSAGGGLVQFVDRGMRDFATEGGGWEARLGFGTKKALTFEAAYVGSLHAIDALGLDTSANLLGTGVEGAIRVNLLPGMVQPYFLAGAGWTRYSLVNTDRNTSDVADSDDLAAFPMGLGVGFRQGQLTLDLRAVYRATASVDMFAGASDGSLSSWSGTLRAGFEY